MLITLLNRQYSNDMNYQDFEFQEKVRQLSICGFDENDKFYYNGWSQLLAMINLYNSYKDNISVEMKSVYNWVVKNNDINKIDVEKNIRGPVKKFLMFPDYSFSPFKYYKDDNLLKSLKNELDNKDHILKIVNGKLYCILPKLSDKLESKIENSETRHLTIINSDKYKSQHEKYDGKIIDDVIYTELGNTGEIRDYPLFKNAIVVKCESKILNNILLDEFGKTKSLHFTVIRELRKPLF